MKIDRSRLGIISAPAATACVASLYLLYAAFEAISPADDNSRVGVFPVKPDSGIDLSAPDGQERPDLSRIADWHMFGASDTAGSIDGSEAPETSLDLKLQGVFHLSRNRKEVYAIVEGSDQTQKSYKIGDELPGGALVRNIETDKMTLIRNGMPESLTRVRNVPITQ